MNKHTGNKTKGNDKRKTNVLEPLLFKEDIKKRYHWGEATFYKWVRTPHLGAFKAHGKWQIRVSDLLEWEDIQIENS